MTKQLFWYCKCGAENAAPADQSSDNTVECGECGEAFEWRQIKNFPGQSGTQEKKALTDRQPVVASRGKINAKGQP